MTGTTPCTSPRATRRAALLAAGAAALAAGCGGSGGGDAGAGGDAAGDGSSPGTPSDTPSRTPSDTAAPGGPAGRELATTDDIPVGGGVVFREEKVVVTQPEQGDFKAFSAICTHQSCLVASVSDGTVDCACHGSRFRITDGSVERGPATRALPAERITVEGNSIRLT
ncbi:Rieske (2Fe-2S) protein [Streptomyces prasinus]|uniref:Rieske (2Fe-2S) protein n=1 Tax=Streptomyces prasinus TaxID=67345 RepID=UPI0006EB3221|nr:Rieske (2Fe-2S) protein [Streptomyces prasinus]